jgi:hypothetical protein
VAALLEEHGFGELSAAADESSIDASDAGNDA